jgi:quinol monooxygenase YgiN
VAKFRIVISGRVKDGQVDAFADLGRRATAFVKDNEPGTVIYGWFVSDDGRFVNEDGYTEDAALLTHLGNMGEQGFLDEYVALVDIESAQVLGEAGDAAREALTAFAAVHYPMIEGF